MFALLDKILKKLLSYYRKCVFKSTTHQKCEKLVIKGKIHVFNKNVILGKNVTLYPGVSFQGNGKIIIGDNTYIGNNTIIYSEKNYNVIIGNDVMIAGNCYIINTNHVTTLSDYPMNTLGTVSEDIVIENNVWLSGFVQVLKGVTIREGSVIGAKALVNKNTENNGIYIGIPAKLMKYRE